MRPSATRDRRSDGDGRADPGSRSPARPGRRGGAAALDRDDAVFDLPWRGGPRGALSREAAAAYLADPSVLHWVAEEDGAVVGHLLCYVERRRRGDERQLLLYEIGVR